MEQKEISLSSLYKGIARTSPSSRAQMKITCLILVSPWLNKVLLLLLLLLASTGELVGKHEPKQL